MNVFGTIRYLAYGYLATKIIFNLLFRISSNFFKSIENKEKQECFFETNYVNEEECLFKTNSIDEEEWGQFIFIDE